MAVGASKLGSVQRVLRQEGPRGLAARMARKGYRRLNGAALDFLLFDRDIADSTRLELPPPPMRARRDRKLLIGWVSTPPSAGSGGHTTMFRMVEALEAAGHTCVLYLYDRYAGDLTSHTEVIRRGWPKIKAQVHDSVELDRAGLVLDGCVATSWVTAHVLARRSVVARRFYFVQDFEPFFYARGSEAALVEDTYHFGFRTIAIGHMVADLVRERCGVEATVAEFGCDTEIYRLTNPGPRSGVVFYTKPDTPRRGYRLGVLALAEFHRTHPEQPIHLFGELPRKLPFPVVPHGKMTPTELNGLYNQTIAGLAMSFTNISLVAEEMLAAGTIPVVNDSTYSRADLHNDSVRWGHPTPGGLADALSAAVEQADVPAVAARAAESVRSGWGPAQTVVRKVIEGELYADA